MLKTVIKYELIKIFNSRLVSVVLLVAFIISFGVSAFNSIQYKSGEKGYYKINDMNGNHFPEIFVSTENIDTLASQLKKFESREEIYETDASIVNTYAGITFKGKYDIDKSALLRAASNGEITNEEYHKALTDYQSAPCIKEEFLADYFELYYPVSCYNNISNNIESTLKWLIEEDMEVLYETSKLAKTVREEQALNKGVVFTYDYGWSLGDEMLSYLVPLYMIVVVFGLCNMFSGEYSLGTDSLVKSTLRGRKKFVLMKYSTAIIYCLISTVAIIVICYLPSLVLVGFSGYNVGTIYTNIEMLLLKFVSLLIGGISISTVVMFFSSLFNKLTYVLFASIITMVIPYVLLYIPSLNFASQIILHLLPFNLSFDSYWLFDNYISIDVIEIFFFIPAVIFNVFSSVIVYFMTVKFFSKHKIMN